MSIHVATVVTIIIGKPVMYVCVAFGWPCMMHARPSVESCSLVDRFIQFGISFKFSMIHAHDVFVCVAF